MKDMNLKPNNLLIRFFVRRIQKYDKDTYWEMREKVVNPEVRINLFYKLYLLYRIKKIDAFNNCSFGTDLNKGAQFKSPPILIHGQNGIIIGHDAIIGKNVTIYHQVTIMHENVIIGDNVVIGAGAKILPNVTVGNNVKIGANCVVISDLPDNCTCVLQKPRILLKS